MQSNNYPQFPNANHGADLNIAQGNASTFTGGFNAANYWPMYIAWLQNACNTQQQQQLSYSQSAQTLQPQPTTVPANLASSSQGSTPKFGSQEEFLLASVLESSASHGLSHSQAIANLAGVNGHSEAAWMRYYIDNITRINAAVSNGPQEASQLTSGPSKPRSPPKTASAHRSYTDGNEDSDPEEVVSLHSTPSREPSIAKNKTTSLRNAASLRQASSTTPKNTVGSSPGNIRAKKLHSSRMPALLNPSVPIASLKSKPALKAPPQALAKSGLRSTKPTKTPVPPRFVERAKTNRGNAWTSEDDRFIAEVITYELERGRCTIDDMCVSMFRQADHHSAPQWKKRTTELPAARKLLSDAGFLQKRSTKAVRIHTPDEGSETGVDESVGSDNPTGSSIGVEDDLQLSTEDESEMGKHGHNYTDADARAMAKWIAMHPEWSGMTAAQRFNGFAEKYSSRTFLAWQEYYRSHKEDLHRRAEEYRAHTTGQSLHENTQEQHHEPASSSALKSSPLKRKAEVEMPSRKRAWYQT
ncbi:uncharacterized protein STEHIDRAFT_164480 [Stereum hirsutum FP-91666 SS1]|uniref:uncharacterized protein n=1 Tax=Stereum hirsutum (strain FP-91666) TaxID=721885 RepID=UPI000440D582|nr:uncharacterized protein STEHIDRAFT_164480 [Stereum hirsutum FP-91666 SS1]EIM92136.1 hypothetical protein STEHIDRAFT_164480 [Stereum hirsutum FP-91666 SS1]